KKMSQNRRKSRRKRDHPVWEYFSSRNSDSDRIYCKECKDPLFSYKSNTSVSNPKRHFMLYHKEIWSQIESECNKTSDKKPQNISMNDMETSSASTSYAGPSNFPANMESPSVSENDVESLDVSTAEKEIKSYTLKNLKKVGISGFVPKNANEVYLETEDNNLEIEVQAGLFIKLLDANWKQQNKIELEFDTDNPGNKQIKTKTNPIVYEIRETAFLLVDDILYNIVTRGFH
ncbi:4325_t:CDS:2, partial [Cetraspora pellucida]